MALIHSESTDNLLPSPAPPTVIVWSPLRDNSQFPVATRWKSAQALTEIFDPSVLIFSGNRGFSSRVSDGLVSVFYQSARLAQQPLLAEKSAWERIRIPLLPEPSVLHAMAERLQKVSPPSWDEPNEIAGVARAPSPLVEVIGGLEQRFIRQEVAIPTLTSKPPSQPCVFRVAVDEDGRVRIVILESSSGNAEADEKAAVLVGALKFAAIQPTPQPLLLEDEQPLPKSRLQWGTAVISFPARPPAEVSAPENSAPPP